MNKHVLYTKTQFKKKFARLMERTSIPDNLPPMETLMLYSKVWGFVSHHIPSKLFRFRKCSIDSFISFEQGTIPVCIADKFPDKYDSQSFMQCISYIMHYVPDFFQIEKINKTTSSQLNRIIEDSKPWNIKTRKLAKATIDKIRA